MPGGRGGAGRALAVRGCAAGSGRRVSRLPSITGKQVIAALKKLGLRKFASEAATTTYGIQTAG